MADIQKYLDDIMEARYGEEVRGSIHDAIEMINTTSEEAVNDANEALDRAEKYIDATDRANEAADRAEEAADKANDAADNLDTHIDEGISDRLEDVNQARDEAREAARKANKAAENAGGGTTTDFYRIVDFISGFAYSETGATINIASGKCETFFYTIDMSLYPKENVDGFILYYSSINTNYNAWNGHSRNLFISSIESQSGIIYLGELNIKNKGKGTETIRVSIKNTGSKTVESVRARLYFIAYKKVSVNSGGISLSDLIAEAQEELSNSRTATSSANRAAQSANEAATQASTAAQSANEAATQASTAAQSANEAAEGASQAANDVTSLIERGEQAVQSANQAAEDANVNAQNALEAAGAATDAVELANSILVSQLVTILTSDWVEDSEESYHAEKIISGLNSTNIVIVDIIQQENLIDEEIRDFWAKVSKVEIGTGMIKVYSSAKPSEDVQMKLIIYHGNTSPIAEAYIINRGVSGGGLNKQSIENASIQLSPEVITYDGMEKTQKVVAIYNDTELTEGTDYILTNNIRTDAGQYELTITGINNFYGEKKIFWKIEKAQGSISVEPNNIEIDKNSGDITTCQINKIGDGNISFSSPSYVNIELSGNELKITPKNVGSENISIILEDGTNYKGSTDIIKIRVFQEYDKIFENNSWTTIVKMCSEGKASKCWSIGDEKKLEIDGNTYSMRIIDFDHDYLDTYNNFTNLDINTYNNGTGKAAMTLMMTTPLNGLYYMNYTPNSSESWDDCYFRKTLIPNYIKTLDDSFSNALRFVSKFTYKRTGALIMEAEWLFLPSEVEVFGSEHYSYKSSVGNKEGTRYKYFSNGGSAEMKTQWYLRSAYYGDTYDFCCVSADGTGYHTKGCPSDSQLTPNSSIVLFACI